MAKQFKLRHTGVYKWFQTYMRASPIDNSLVFGEFDQAVRAVGGAQIVPVTIQDIFTKLDSDSDTKVAITDIESLFKEFNRRSHPTISSAQVCSGVLKAFNGDVQFIDGELQSITNQNGGILPTEETVRFFTKYNGWQSFYGEDEIHVFVDSFMLGAGKVAKNQLIEALYNQLRLSPNLQPNPQQMGIHRMGVSNTSGPGAESHTPLRSFDQFSEDGTKSVETAYNLVPFKTLPRISDQNIEELQKACFIRARTVREYFAGVHGVRDEHMTLTHFQNGLDDLGLTWSRQDVEDAFRELIAV